MAKRKTTIYVDEELLRALKVQAARLDKRDSEVFEEALRAYLGFGLLDRIWEAANMPEDEALRIAYEELHSSRTGDARET